MMYICPNTKKCTIQRMSPNVNYALYLIIIIYLLNFCDKCITLMQYVNYQRKCRIAEKDRVYRNSILPVQCFCKPETNLKIKLINDEVKYIHIGVYSRAYIIVF